MLETSEKDKLKIADQFFDTAKFSLIIEALNRKNFLDDNFKKMFLRYFGVISINVDSLHVIQNYFISKI